MSLYAKGAESKLPAGVHQRGSKAITPSFVIKETQTAPTLLNNATSIFAISVKFFQIDDVRITAVNFL